MAIEIKAKISPALYNKLKEKIIDEDISEAEYLVNLVTDDLFPEFAERSVEEEKEFNPFIWLNDNDFDGEVITELFIILAQKMSINERRAAQKLLSLPAEKLGGIYDLPKKQAETKKVAAPDAMGISNEAAEQVIGRQESKLDNQDDDENYGEEEPEDKKVEMVKGRMMGKNQARELSSDLLKNVYEEYDDEQEDLEDEEAVEYFDEEADAPAEPEKEEFEMNVIEELNKSTSIIKPTQKEMEKIASHQTARNKIKKAAVQQEILDALDGRVESMNDNNDPDDDEPDWNESSEDMEKRATGVFDVESEKVINEAPGLSAPVQPKTPVKLNYDPRDPSSKNHSVILGQHANDTNRTKPNSRRASVAQGAQFLKGMGANQNEIQNIVKSN